MIGLLLGEVLGCESYLVELETPKNEVHVCTVPLQSVLKLSVPFTQSNVEIWANDESEPDKICIIVF